MNCDFNNPNLTCPTCGYVAKAAQWRRNCPQAQAERPTRAPGGPGTELKQILEQLGFKLGSCTAGCEARVRQMDHWQPRGCRQRRSTIVGWLSEGAARAGWQATAWGAAAAALHFADFWPNPLDPFGSIVDEAIARAETRRA